MTKTYRKLESIRGAAGLEEGLTLVEIMVALVLSLVLLAGVVQIFLSSKSGYRVQEGLARVQENGRAAMDLLSRDVRMAGYQGCPNLDSIKPANIVRPDAAIDDISFNLSEFIVGYELDAGGGWSPSTPARLSGVWPGTDVLTIRHGGDCGAYLVGNYDPNNAQIHVAAPNTCDFKAGDVLFITDCRDADIFRASTVSTTGGATKVDITHAGNYNDPNKLSKIYREDAQVLKFRAASYFVRAGAGGQPALWRLLHERPTGGDNPHELVEGVESMQVLYGVDSSNDYTADCYVTAADFPATTPPSSNCNNSNRWRDVVSVRVSLLMRTLDDRLAPDPVQYSYNGATVSDPGDHRLRRVFTTTINLRNRVP